MEGEEEKFRTACFHVGMWGLKGGTVTGELESSGGGVRRSGGLFWIGHTTFVGCPDEASPPSS